jgi:methionyl-tRNA formyltransferase
MEEGLDTGPVYATRPLPIGPATTAPELHECLAALAAAMIPGIVAGIAAGTLSATPQPETGVTYARKLERAEGRIDFAESAEAIDRRLRALNPSPGCWCLARGERLGLIGGRVVSGTGDPGRVVALPLTVACGEAALEITRVQRAGRKPMPPDELQRGFALPVGTLLG